MLYSRALNYLPEAIPAVLGVLGLTPDEIREQKVARILNLGIIGIDPESEDFHVRTTRRLSGVVVPTNQGLPEAVDTLSDIEQLKLASSVRTSRSPNPRTRRSRVFRSLPALLRISDQDQSRLSKPERLVLGFHTLVLVRESTDISLTDLDGLALSEEEARRQVNTHEDNYWTIRSFLADKQCGDIGRLLIDPVDAAVFEFANNRTSRLPS